MTSIYHLRTAISAPVSIKAYPVNDPREYAARIFARLGIDTDETGSAEKLARLENRAMRERLQSSPGASATQSIHGKMNRYASLRDAAKARHEAIHAQIYAILAEGEATKRDVSRVLGCHNDTAGDYLRDMARAGMINVETVRQCKVYSLPRQDAAE